jgi:hypothetical protein
MNFVVLDVNEMWPILWLGSFSIAVVLWDALSTYVALKDKHSTELNPFMGALFEMVGIKNALVLSRAIVILVVFVFMFGDAPQYIKFNTLAMMACLEAGLVGWTVSGDFHNKDFRKQLDKHKINWRKWR